MYETIKLLYNRPIDNRKGGSMYRLNKFPNHVYQLTKSEGGRFKPYFQGTEHQVKSLMEYEQFDEIDVAFDEMFKNDHNCAEFGVMRRFLYTFTNESLFKVFQ